MKHPILVSACLAGIPCNYKGKAHPIPEIIQMVKEGKAIPVCPECLGGLSTPRSPAEQKNNRVVTKNGDDVTDTFTDGAKKTLAIAKEHGCIRAILKARSPSCGKGKVYDGSFSKTLVDKNGVTAQLLMKNGIKVQTEEEI